jgi:hypothetical protein
MPRFSLRTLLVVMLLGGPVCAWGRLRWEAYRERDRRSEFDKLLDSIMSNYPPGPVGPITEFRHLCADFDNSWTDDPEDDGDSSNEPEDCAPTDRERLVGRGNDDPFK